MQRYARKLLTMVRFGWDLKNLSTCKRATVGAVVFAPDCSRVYSIGYNGPAHTRHNQACRNTEGDCGCVHAEANAIVKLQGQRGLMYCSTLPCEACASLILNSQAIQGFIWSNKYRSDVGHMYLMDARIPVVWTADLDRIVEKGIEATGRDAELFDTLYAWHRLS